MLTTVRCGFEPSTLVQYNRLRKGEQCPELRFDALFASNLRIVNEELDKESSFVVEYAINKYLS